MSYENIPGELKRIPNWLVWRAEHLSNGKTTKIPIQSRNGWGADVTNSAHLSSFEEAVNATRNEGVSGIGFAFTEHDEYGGIDYDNCADPEKWPRYEKILTAFNSYTEYSPSGNGLHTIIKARTPNGRRRDGVELYTSGRFFTFTGNIYGAPKPIAERQSLALQLYNEMGNGADISEHYLGDASPKHWDEEVIAMASNASNGTLFQALMNGDWQSCGYPSQSEADQALMNIIVFYTKNRAQAARIFKSSGLGQREKAQRYKYLEYTMDKAFDQTLPPINLDNLINQINDAIAAKKAQPVQQQQANASHTNIDLDLWKRERPPGLMGEMVDYFLAQSQLPVYEISLAAALGLMAGICGRAYNINRSGLNLYIMLLAGTGRGKDAMKTGISSLVSAVAKEDVGGQKFEAALEFLGPRNAVSGAGLLKHIAKFEAPSYVSLTGEIGKRFKQLTDKNANTADKTFTTALLDLYTAAKHDEPFMGTSYSQEKDSIKTVMSPAFTWLGEGEPIGFYDALSDSNISEGLIPRFIIIEYAGARVDDNDDMHRASPPYALIRNTKQLMELALSNNQQNNVIVPTFTPDGEARHKFYRKFCRDRMDELDGTPVGQLWNRSHLNIIRVAALLSIAHNMAQPVITAKMVDWAASLVMTNSYRLTDKFSRGIVGGGDMSKALTKLAKIVVGFHNGTIRQDNARETKCVNEGCISRSMFSRNCLTNHPFKDDKNMLTAAIAELVKLGALHQITEEGSRAEIYQIRYMEWFLRNATD